MQLATECARLCLEPETKADVRAIHQASPRPLLCAAKAQETACSPTVLILLSHYFLASPCLQSAIMGNYTHGHTRTHMACM